MIWDIYNSKLNQKEQQLFRLHLMPRLTINFNQFKVNEMKTLLHEFVKQFNVDCVNIILNYTKDIRFNINTLTKHDLKHGLNISVYKDVVQINEEIRKLNYV